MLSVYGGLLEVACAKWSESGASFPLLFAFNGMIEDSEKQRHSYELLKSLQAA